MKLRSIFVASIFLMLAAVSAGVIHSEAAASEASDMYNEMRKMALGMAATDIGLNPADDQAFGVVMDIDFDGETATITSFTTGDASLYLSSGGGMIGGGGHESVAQAAKQFVAVAQASRSRLAPTTKFPRPVRGQINFYVISPKGVLTAQRPEQALGEGKDELSDLFYAGQNVLTQMRTVQK